MFRIPGSGAGFVQKLVISGSADERGTETYNLALGQRRADAVRNYLEARGYPSALIRTVSLGKDCPLAPGHDEEAWRMNRNAIGTLGGTLRWSCH
jgi:peptidoglycan-associated lipoprotein